MISTRWCLLLGADEVDALYVCRKEVDYRHWQSVVNHPYPVPTDCRLLDPKGRSREPFGWESRQFWLTCTPDCTSQWENPRNNFKIECHSQWVYQFSECSFGRAMKGSVSRPAIWNGCSMTSLNCVCIGIVWQGIQLTSFPVRKQMQTVHSVLQV